MYGSAIPHTYGSFVGTREVLQLKWNQHTWVKAAHLRVGGVWGGTREVVLELAWNQQTRGRCLGFHVAVGQTLVFKMGMWLCNREYLPRPDTNPQILMSKGVLDPLRFIASPPEILHFLLLGKAHVSGKQTSPHFFLANPTREVSCPCSTKLPNEHFAAFWQGMLGLNNF